LYNKEEFGWGLSFAEIMTLNGLVAVLLVVPFMWHLVDMRNYTEVRPLKLQCQNLWQMVQLRSGEWRRREGLEVVVGVGGRGEFYPTAAFSGSNITYSFYPTTTTATTTTYTTTTTTYTTTTYTTTIPTTTVYQPMAFIAVYNMLMIPNAAWSSFLLLGLHFTDWQLGIIGIAASGFSWLGIALYRYVLYKRSWRTIYVITTIFIVIFSVFQVTTTTTTTL